MTDNIDSIILYFENGDNIKISNDLFCNLYISNLDNKAEEMPYEKLNFQNKLYANFFMIKINKLINEYYHSDIISRLEKKYDITEIVINFKNQKHICFYLASNADPFAAKYENNLENTYITDDYLCILISEYKIKYKDYLFI